MGKDYEHTISNGIGRNTPESVRAYRCGMSGSSALPQPDVLVTTDFMNHGMELKGPIQKDVLYVEGDDLQQIVDVGNDNTAVYLVVKFPYREPLVVKYFSAMVGDADFGDLSVTEQFDRLVPSAFDSTVTKSGNLRIRKPSTDEWPSTQSGRDDVETVLDGLAIASESSHEAI